MEMEMEVEYSRKPHFVLIPLLAQGHMIPMVDMARLFAKHGAIVTLVITPGNASRLSSTLHRARETEGLEIHILEIPFPCQEHGLPHGCENLDSLASPALIKNFYAALDSLQEPTERYLEETNNPPSCIVSDKCLSWTSKTARRFHVPRLVFHGMCCFSLLCSNNIMLHKPHLSVKSDTAPFPIPGLPFSMEIAKAQLPGAFVTLPNLDGIRGQMQEAESSAYGVVVNTFQELERGCVEEYRKVVNKKVWCLGPVSLCNRDVMDMYHRGNRASIDEKQCLKWLDSEKQNSVLYACLGSQCRLVPSQLIELGLGLEASNHPFIWVIKTGERYSELEKWFEDERFEERINGRGLVIKGWAPQVMILNHPSIGGFLTHCGWNSTIEGVCSGVVMITWPMFAEQFLNEKMIVEVLGIGIRVGVDVPVRWGEEERVGVVVVKDEVAKAVEKLMDGGEEGEKRRNKARELGLVAKSAMKDGGQAHVNISNLVQDIMNISIKRCNQ